MKRCCSCGRTATTGYFVCTECRDRFPAMGVELVQSGLRELTLYVPENVVVRVSPMSSGRKYLLEAKKHDPLKKVKDWWRGRRW